MFPMGRYTECGKKKSGGVTPVIVAVFIGAFVGCIFGLLNTALAYLLQEDERSNISQKLSRSIIEGSFVGAVFGSLFSGLKLMM